MLELLDAKRIVQNSNEPHTAIDTHDDNWTLMEATDIMRSGWKNTVIADFIGAETRKWIQFEFDSAEPMLGIGDIFNFRGAEVSLFDTEKMRPRTYKIRVLETNADQDDN